MAGSTKPLGSGFLQVAADNTQSLLNALNEHSSREQFLKDKNLKNPFSKLITAPLLLRARIHYLSLPPLVGDKLRKQYHT